MSVGCSPSPPAPLPPGERGEIPAPPFGGMSLRSSAVAGEIISLAQIGEVAPVEDAGTSVVGIDDDFEAYLGATELVVTDDLKAVDLGVGGDVVGYLSEDRGIQLSLCY